MYIGQRLVKYYHFLSYFAKNATFVAQYSNWITQFWMECLQRDQINLKIIKLQGFDDIKCNFQFWVCKFWTLFSGDKNAYSTLSQPNLALMLSFHNFIFIFINGRPSSSKWVINHICRSNIGWEKGYMKNNTIRETPCI